MTYARAPGTFAAAWSAAMAAVGRERLAAALGISVSRCEQYANPMRADEAPYHRCRQADLAAARAGAGTPLYDAYGQWLAARGALPRSAAAGEVRALRAVLGAVQALIARALAPGAGVGPGRPAPGAGVGPGRPAPGARVGPGRPAPVDGWAPA